MIRLGQDLELAVPRSGLPLRCPDLLLSFCPFDPFRIVQSTTAISQGDMSMDLPSNTGPTYSRCLAAMEFIQTNGRWRRANYPKTKPVDIFSLSKAEALGGVDYHPSGFKHGSVRVFGLKGRD